MTGAATGILVALGVIALVLVIVRMVGCWLDREGESKVVRRYPDPKLIELADSRANFLGLSSRGVAQLRGNGILVLAKQELWFDQAVTQFQLTIPIEAIRRVDFTSSHLGKYLPGRRLLRVEFTASTGVVDTAVWAVREPDRWLERLQAKLAAAGLAAR